MQRPFKRLLAVYCLFFAFLFAKNVLAQDPPKPFYAYLSYIKVDRDKSEAYLNHVRTYGQQIYQDRVNRGEIISWALFTVIMRTDHGDEYNYVSVTTTSQLKSITDASQTPQQILKRLKPEMDEKTVAETLAQLGQMRAMVGNDVMLRMDQLASMRGATSKYYEMNYMKVPYGKDADYEKLERESFKPLHKERQDLGDINYWSLWKVAYPNSDTRSYNYITMNTFADIDKMVTSDYAAAYRKVFPKGDMNKLATQMMATRTMQKTEVWRREITTSAPQK